MGGCYKAKHGSNATGWDEFFGLQMTLQLMYQCQWTSLQAPHSWPLWECLNYNITAVTLDTSGSLSPLRTHFLQPGLSCRIQARMLFFRWLLLFLTEGEIKSVNLLTWFHCPHSWNKWAGGEATKLLTSQFTQQNRPLSLPFVIV